MSPHHSVRVAAYAILIKNHKVLLLLRKNTGWMDGNYGLPAGHLEKNETIKEGIIREIKEEIGLDVEQTNLKFYHVMHRNEVGINNFEYVDFFFKLEYWEGEPKNEELDKHGDIKWFDIDFLPKNIVPNVKAGIDYYRSKIIFSEFS